MTPNKKPKNKKKFSRISIERIGFNKKGQVIFIDLHDEKFGDALFFSEPARHYHGFLNGGNYEE